MSSPLAPSSDLIARLVAHIIAECSAVDMEARFCSTFDELNTDNLPSWLSHCTPSDVLKEMDPTAFRCGVADMDTSDLYEISGEHYEQREVDAAREAFVDALKTDIDAAEAHAF